jgi:hypothetical protein
METLYIHIYGNIDIFTYNHCNLKTQNNLKEQSQRFLYRAVSNL